MTLFFLMNLDFAASGAEAPESTKRRYHGMAVNPGRLKRR